MQRVSSLIGFNNVDLPLGAGGIKMWNTLLSYSFFTLNLIVFEYKNDVPIFKIHELLQTKNKKI